MTSKERIMTAWAGEPADHLPLTTWCFGFSPPEHLRWERDGRPINYWYSTRLEHIHTLPEPWELADDFQRAAAWLSPTSMASPCSKTVPSATAAASWDARPARSGRSASSASSSTRI